MKINDIVGHKIKNIREAKKAIKVEVLSKNIRDVSMGLPR